MAAKIPPALKVTIPTSKESENIKVIEDSKDSKGPSSSGAFAGKGPEMDTEMKEVDALTKRAVDTQLKLCQLVHPTNDSEWKFVSNTNGIVISKQIIQVKEGQVSKVANGSAASNETNGTVVCFRGVGTVPTSPEETLCFLWDLERKKEYDSFFESFRIVKDLDELTQVNYQTTTGVFPVSGRDFVYLARRHLSQDKKMAILSAETIETKLCPPNPKYVRGTVKTSGYVIEAIDDDASSAPPAPKSAGAGLFKGNGKMNEKNKMSKLTFVINMNLNGSIPSFITTHIYEDIPKIVGKIKQVLSSKSSQQKAR